MKSVAILVLASGLLGAESRAYLVLQKGASSLAYYSADGKLLATVPVKQHPHEMVFSPDRRYLYTVDNGTMRIEHPGSGGNSISIIDVRAKKKIGDIDLGKFHRPHGIDIDKKTGHLVVTTELPDQLLLIDPKSRTVLKTFETKGKTSHMVSLGPGAELAFVSNSSSGQVAVINLKTSAVKLILTGTRPEGSALSQDGKELFVCNREASSISVIDTARQDVTGTIATGKGPVRIAVTPDGKQLVYALMHEKKIGFADPKSRRQTGAVSVGGTPVSLTISEDGKLAFASAEETDTVYVVSIADKKVVGEIKTAKGAGPDPVLDARF